MSLLLNFYKDKTVLVTGHTGFKGSWLCEVLLSAGAKVVGYSLESPTNPNLFGLLDLENRMTSVLGDVRDFGKLKQIFDECQPDIVFHLAAQPIVIDSYKEPRYTFETNIMGTVNVLECIRLCPSVKSFVNITTDKVYENNDLYDHRFKENEKLDGYDPYSNSKSCSELVTHSYKRCFFDYPRACAISTARAGNVIGGGDFSPHRIIVDAVKSALSRGDLIVRNKNSTRPYQFVLEALFVYLLIAAKQYRDEKYAGYYNVGPDQCDAVSTGDLATMFCQAWGEGMKWIDHSNSDAPHESAYLALDNTLLKQRFKWTPAMHVEEAVSWVVEWAKCYGSGSNTRLLVDKQISVYDKIFEDMLCKNGNSKNCL